MIELKVKNQTFKLKELLTREEIKKVKRLSRQARPYCLYHNYFLTDEIKSEKGCELCFHYVMALPFRRIKSVNQM